MFFEKIDNKSLLIISKCSKVFFKASVSYLDAITDKYEKLDLSGSFKTDSERLDFKDKILLDNISFRYPEEDKDALSQINLEIPSCNIIGIIGSTGSGKTTIVDVILGLLKSSKGGLYVDGEEIIKENVRQWQRSIGYVPQHISLIDESISSNIALGEDPDNLNICGSSIKLYFSGIIFLFKLLSNQLEPLIIVSPFIALNI